MDPIFQVPTIDIRDRISTEVIESIARSIAERFKPQAVILFGSYAYGAPEAESDIDLLVIMKTALKEIEQTLLIRQYINPLFGIDLIVYTPENLDRRLKLGDQFLQEVLSKGRVLYESAHN